MGGQGRGVGVGERSGGRKQIHVEKRTVYCLYFIVDNSSFLLSAKFMVCGRYRYKRDWLPMI